MTQELNFLEGEEENVIGRVDGAGDAVDRMRNRYASTQNWVIFNIVNTVENIESLKLTFTWEETWVID